MMMSGAPQPMTATTGFLFLFILHPALSQLLQLQCPHSIENPHIFRVEGVETRVKVPVYSGLCLLVQVNEDGDHHVPVARSFQNNNWERAGGSFGIELPEWQCRASSDGTTSCTNTLPPGMYRLERRIRRRQTTEESWARFLEKTTFGIKSKELKKRTRKDLTKDRTFSSYIQQQLKLPITSHREYYRRRLNPVKEYHHPTYATRANPCATRSTWSRQFWSVEDTTKVIRVSQTVDGNSKRQRVEIKIDEEIRSITENFRFDLGGLGVESVKPAKYFYCGSTEDALRGMLYLKTKFQNEEKCRRVLASDTLVNFDVLDIPDNVMQLGDGDAAGSLDDQSQWKAVPTHGQNAPTYVREAPIASNQCDDSSSEAKLPTLFQVDSNKIPTIFLKVQSGEWLIHRPSTLLLGNSLSSPESKGGYSNYNQNRTKFCANVPRSFSNEKSCTLSKKRACRSNYNNDFYGESIRGAIVCGSPNEVSNDPSLGDAWLGFNSVRSKNYAAKLGIPQDVVREDYLRHQREAVWSHVALIAPDQLRQRVAWALFQIFSLPKTSIGLESVLTEAFLAYYDIFVRHAFGNYLDILREIAYNPLMAESLSFIGGRSLGLAFADDGLQAYPDENFAREIMQLFTIGLVQLNEDGSPKLDSDGNPIPTYDMNDVANFARAWTGFDYQPVRANIEFGWRNGWNNPIDPLKIIPLRRDRFPKSNLDEGYIGDGYPLCSDFPKQSFLLAGAKYRLLGVVPQPELVHDVLTNKMGHLVLNKESPLYHQLCGAVDGDKCAYPSVVELKSNASCEKHANTREECQIDQARVVQIDNVFYEYIQPSCVEHVFYINGRRVVSDKSNQRDAVCVNPVSASASEACCSTNGQAKPQCLFSGERMTFDTAKKRCLGANEELCEFKKFTPTQACSHRGHFWTPTKCEILAKVSATGQVAIVHDVKNPQPLVGVDSPSHFNVYWENGDYPLVENGCGGVGCSPLKGECLCSVSVSETPVVLSKPSKLSDFVRMLKVGFPNPSLLGSKLTKIGEGAGYKIYSAPGETCCNQNTVFEVEMGNGENKYYRNVQSTVSIKSTLFKFRNPPSFNSLVPSEYTAGSAAHETEAVLDYLFRHPNTAPFVAYRIIQRFGVSNPSPTYVKAVANAFSSGSAVRDGVQIGSGKYGDMAATVAEALLHEESVDPGLNSDPSHGALKEPIVKVIGVLRALDFEPSTPLLNLQRMSDKIGQAPYGQPSVFNFFKPEFSPPEIAASSMLKAPELQPMTAGKIIGLLNGFFSLFDNGLAACHGGFSSYGCADSSDLPDSNGELQLPSIDSVDGIVRELVLSLTAGRLPKSKQDIMRTALQNMTSPKEVQRKAAQYIVTTPEFHSTSFADAITYGKQEVPIEEPKGRPKDGYKAVIHISLEGGCDSFNMLVPAPFCKLYDSYKQVRGSLAVAPEDLRLINAKESDQPCGSFGVNHKLDTLHSLYKDGDLAFIANTGILNRASTDETNYEHNTVSKLFAHNTMQQEVKTLDPFQKVVATGTLGRVADQLKKKGYRVSLTSVEATMENLNGRDSANSLYNMDASGEIARLEWNHSTPLAASIEHELLGGGDNSSSSSSSTTAGTSHSGVYGDLWSNSVAKAVQQSESLYEALLQQEISEGTEQTQKFPDTPAGQRAQLVARLIRSHEARKVDRDFFFFTIPGFDTHSRGIPSVEAKFTLLNDALRPLVDSLKASGHWDEVVIVQTSEFGRTLTPNSSGGSDHGWGGNTFVAGGSVKGGQILGDYIPSFHHQQSKTILPRGRVIPTTPLESPFQAVAEWTGVTKKAHLKYVLPNREQFQGKLFIEEDLFEKQTKKQ